MEILNSVAGFTGSNLWDTDEVHSQAVLQGLMAPGMTQPWSEGPRPYSPESSWGMGET